MAQSPDREQEDLSREDQQNDQGTNKGEHSAETGNEDLGEGDMNRKQFLNDDTEGNA